MPDKYFILGFVLVIHSLTFAQGDSLYLFTDDFESCTAGQQLVCQDTLYWDTWSSLPCDSVEDPYVTDTVAHSGLNSICIRQNNDLIKPIPNYKTGKYSIRFYLYIPADYMASWGQLTSYITPDSTEWGFFVKFNQYGNGSINAAGWGTAQFPFVYNTWMYNELIVDLNNDSAEYYFEGTLVHSWRWSDGGSGDTLKCQLAATDLMGSNWPNLGLSQWYLDDYILERTDVVVSAKDFSLPTEFTLNQNCPNPFNPTTTIRFTLPVSGVTTLKIYNILGKVIATLVNGEQAAGGYEVKFDASAISSGIYFYQLRSGNVGQTKKMLLVK